LYPDDIWTVKIGLGLVLVITVYISTDNQG